jgi:acetylornithine/N-succinyldiaminopimelate aminotransferase
VISTIEVDGLLDHVAKVGDHFAAGLAAVPHPALHGVRGKGLWLALELAEPIAPAVEKASRDAGFLVNAVQPDAIRIAPPLVLSVDEADRYIDALPGVLAAATGDPS